MPQRLSHGFTTVAVDPANPLVVFVGTNYQGLWRSADQGVTWAKIDTGSGRGLIDSGRQVALAIGPQMGLYDPVHHVSYAVNYLGGVWKINPGPGRLNAEPPGRTTRTGDATATRCAHTQVSHFDVIQHVVTEIAPGDHASTVSVRGRLRRLLCG